MTATNQNIPFEPSRDEIALQAFLAWERDGRQPNLETHYWLQAENTLRAERRALAEATAALATKPWPPTGSTPLRKSTKPVTMKAPAPATAPTTDRPTNSSPSSSA